MSWSPSDRVADEEYIRVGSLDDRLCDCMERDGYRFLSEEDEEQVRERPEDYRTDYYEGVESSWALYGPFDVIVESRGRRVTACMHIDMALCESEDWNICPGAGTVQMIATVSETEDARFDVPTACLEAYLGPCSPSVDECFPFLSARYRDAVVTGHLSEEEAE